VLRNEGSEAVKEVTQLVVRAHREQEGTPGWEVASMASSRSEWM